MTYEVGDCVTALNITSMVIKSMYNIEPGDHWIITKISQSIADEWSMYSLIHMGGQKVIYIWDTEICKYFRPFDG